MPQSPTQTSTTYALLIAIDQYLVAGNLRGCVNDSIAVESYLNETIGKRPDCKLDILSLRNEQATRQNIIKGFLEHLTKAQRGDIVFVHYSGHGSQENADKLFWKMEPDHRNETLVCHDSRSKEADGKTIWDLSDKETAWMLSEIAKNQPHIVVVFDCCHSGSGTRELVRHASMANYVRPAQNYVFAERDATYRDLLEKPDTFDIPKTQHIFFSGCSSSQTAKEMRAEDGKSYGAFTYSLLETLKKAGGNLSYRDVITRAGSLVANRAHAQTPQLEAHHGADANRLFLDGTAAKTHRYFTVKYEDADGWVMDGGSFNGIPTAGGDDKTILYLYGEDVEFFSDAKHLYEAEVTRVMPAKSKINIKADSSIDPSTIFKAIMAELPVNKLKVHFKAETPAWDSLQEGVDLLRKSFEKDHAAINPALFLEEVGEREGAAYVVVAYEHFSEFKYRIAKADDEERPVAEQVTNFTDTSANEIIRQLVQIARWEMAFDLQNIPRAIAPSDVQLEISTCFMEEVTKEITQEKWLSLNSGEIELPYIYSKTTKKWRAPEFRVKVTNHSDRTIYCSLLALIFDYSITNALLPRAELKPGETAFAFEGESVQAILRESLYQLGITQIRNSLVLLVSTEDFDSKMLEQRGLKQMTQFRSTGSRNTLELLFNKANTRNFGRKSEALPNSDWFTHRISMTIIRPLDKVGGKLIEQAGIELPESHELKADYSLSCTEHGQRMRGGYNDDYIPEILLDQGDFTETIQLVSGRGAAPELNLLELKNVENASSVTPDNPFTVKIPADLVGDGNIVIPIAKDGDIFLPLGFGVEKGGTKVAVDIERLPEPSETYTRGLGNTIKILFQKVVGKKLGWGYEYPHLSHVTKNGEGQLDYNNNLLQVGEAVRKSNSKKIVVVIHGVNGETRDFFQPDSRQSATPFLDLLEKYYDLVLAFDYDSYGTKLTKTALDLKERLKNVGLSAGHGKTLDLVVHSMGGLVSRQFVEKEGGKQAVRRLIMLGTPNNGSPLPSVLDWTKMGLTFAINQFAFGSIPVLNVLAESLKKIKSVTGGIGLGDQVMGSMKPGSEFLESLEQSDDPKVPYRIISGNTSLIQKTDATREKKIRKILNKLGIPNNLHYGILNLLFREENDIAVSVSSINHVPGNRHPAPVSREVACHHLNYFSSEEGLEAIDALLKYSVN